MLARSSCAGWETPQDSQYKECLGVKVDSVCVCVCVHWACLELSQILLCFHLLCLVRSSGRKIPQPEDFHRQKEGTLLAQLFYRYFLNLLSFTLPSAFVDSELSFSLTEYLEMGVSHSCLSHTYCVFQFSLVCIFHPSDFICFLFPQHFWSTDTFSCFLFPVLLEVYSLNVFIYVYKYICI